MEAGNNLEMKTDTFHEVQEKENDRSLGRNLQYATSRFNRHTCGSLYRAFLVLVAVLCCRGRPRPEAEGCQRRPHRPRMSVRCVFPFFSENSHVPLTRSSNCCHNAPSSFNYLCLHHICLDCRQRKYAMITKRFLSSSCPPPLPSSLPLPLFIILHNYIIFICSLVTFGLLRFLASRGFLVNQTVPFLSRSPLALLTIAPFVNYFVEI